MTGIRSSRNRIDTAALSSPPPAGSFEPRYANRTFDQDQEGASQSPLPPGLKGCLNRCRLALCAGVGVRGRLFISLGAAHFISRHICDAGHCARPAGPSSLPPLGRLDFDGGSLDVQVHLTGRHACRTDWGRSGANAQAPQARGSTTSLCARSVDPARGPARSTARDGAALGGSTPLFRRPR
jgi:hypothetical protein